MQTQNRSVIAVEFDSEGIPVFFRTPPSHHNAERVLALIDNSDIDEWTSEMLMEYIFAPTSAKDSGVVFRKEITEKIRSIRTMDMTMRRMSPVQSPLLTRKQAKKRFRTASFDPDVPSIRQFTFGTVWAYSRSSLENLERSEFLKRQLLYQISKES